MSAKEPIDLSSLTPYAALIPNPLIAATVGVLLKYGPKAYLAVVDLIHKPDPTKADFIVILKDIDSKTYDDYIAEAKAAALPPPGA